MIRPLSVADVPALADLATVQLAATEYPFDTSAEVMHRRAERALGNDGLFAENRRWIVYGAFEDSRLTAAVRAYAVDGSAEAGVPADIVWLLFEPDYAAAAEAVLQHTLEWIGTQPHGLQAFGLAHGFGWCAGQPDAWSQVSSLMESSGFAQQGTSYLMWGDHLSDFSGAAHSAVRVEFGRETNDVWRFAALLGEHEIGEMKAIPMDASTGWQPTWPGARWIDWVHVDEQHRRSGVAAALFRSFAQHCRAASAARVAAYTGYPAAIRLNEQLGITRRIAVRSYVRRLI